MATVHEQIVEKIKERLLLIDSADGFGNTASDVIGPTRIAQHSPSDFQIVVQVASITPKPQLDNPGNPMAIGQEMIVNIVAELSPSETDETPLDTYLLSFGADIAAAVTTGNFWWNFDNLAINTKQGRITPVRTESGSGVSVPLIITLRVQEDDYSIARP